MATVDEIKSFAFFDLETTGLPVEENNRTKITELSIIACSKEHLLASESIPRVLHKLTLCFNPFKRISQKSEDITKLNNELLEHEREFDENAGKTILGFLEQMQQPCVLVAHNGDKFDFPILRKSFERLKMHLPETVLLADSLPIFKDIELQEEMNLSDSAAAAAACVEALEDDDKLKALAHEFDEKEKAESEKNADETSKPEEILPAETETFKSPQKPSSSREDMQKINETTPKNQKITSKVPSKLLKVAAQKRFIDEYSTTRKNLFAKNYKLTSIYERFTGDVPETSHYAESDVVTLMKCASAKKEMFVELVEKYAVPFQSTTIKRKLVVE